MFRRTVVVVASYLLSLGGFPYMFLGMFGLLFNEPGGLLRVIPLIWLFAWISHAYMSVAWIRNRPLSRRWPLLGTAAGVFSLASPMLTVIGQQHPTPVTDTLQGAFIASALVSALFLPCILLAIYVAHFHWHS